MANPFYTAGTIPSGLARNGPINSELANIEAAFDAAYAEFTAPEAADMDDSQVKGRAVGAGTGAVTDLTAAQLYAIFASLLVGSVSYSSGNTGAVFESGGNDVGGYYVKFADGTLRCRINKLQLDQTSTFEMESTWTMPATFIDDNYSVAPAFRPPTDSGAPSTIADHCTPGRTMLAPPSFGAKTTTTVKIQCVRINGMTNFSNGDRLYVSVIAEGRWRA